jgi:hypothetical protein
MEAMTIWYLERVQRTLSEAGYDCQLALVIGVACGEGGGCGAVGCWRR